MRILVIHYELAEAHSLCDRIRRDGHEVSPYLTRGPNGFRTFSDNPPDVIVIDLMRLPFYGRAMGAMLRERKSTRQIPLVFIAGDPEKTERTRRLLPDAVYTDLRQVGVGIERALKTAPADPVVPRNGYGTPVAQKLRIREGSVVAARNAPEGFEAMLGQLPEGARLQHTLKDADVILTFVKSVPALSKEVPLLATAREMRPGISLWVCWPKKAGKLAATLTMPDIHEMVNAYAMTAYKSCSLDENWSAVAVAKRGIKSRRSSER